MKTDRQGCSTCPPGQERFETFNHPWRKGQSLVQYEYRKPSGELFAIVRPTLEECRQVRDGWIDRALLARLEREK